MTADVVLLPTGLNERVVGSVRTVIVLDVLRATTTMAAALAAGIREIRIFHSIDAARQAAQQHGEPCLLCGEVNCLPPPGFDLGNSPGSFTPQHASRTVFMATTNGTRAIVAAVAAVAQASRLCSPPDHGNNGCVLVGALVNAAAVADFARQLGRDVILLCAGTNGQVSMEDIIAAGAILHELDSLRGLALASDVARMALRLFRSSRDDLRHALSEAQGGKNVIKAGLSDDIEFAARLNAHDVVGRVATDPLRVVSAV